MSRVEVFVDYMKIAIRVGKISNMYTIVLRQVYWFIRNFKIVEKVNDHPQVGTQINLAHLVDNCHIYFKIKYLFSYLNQNNRWICDRFVIKRQVIIVRVHYSSHVFLFLQQVLIL